MEIMENRTENANSDKQKSRQQAITPLKAFLSGENLILPIFLFSHILSLISFICLAKFPRWGN
jgi:hypothetical protein